MALWVCRGCTAAYSVGAPRCPQCDGTDRYEEGQQDMAKVTVHGGPSNAAGEGEDVSVGSSSETSSVTPSASPKTNVPGHPKPARTTGSRSAKGRTDSSSASGTAGARTDRSSDGDAS